MDGAGQRRAVRRAGAELIKAMTRLAFYAGWPSAVRAIVETAGNAAHHQPRNKQGRT